MARWLLANDAPSGGPANAGERMQRLCTRLSHNLRWSLGDDGYDALLTRALKRAEAEHRSLKDFYRITDSGIQLDGVAAAIHRHGETEVAAAIESLLTALIELLSSLIGADMVLNLLDLNGPPTPRGGQAP
ncbi:MAG TPA: hypothetical protein VFT29_05240 [Gemmatimonadaceae bacterium]|nr:hypothetical protein [Gemmatimonadaceae bacterium]